MKVWAILALTAILSLLSGCTDMFRTELDETQSKLKALQELAASVNNDLTTLSEIVARLDDKQTIDPSSIVTTEEGYDVSFRDGKTIHLHFGVDGVDGRTLIPVGVRQDEDGLYYWQVDGEWLTDGDNNKIRAAATDGKNGFVPQTKVEDGVWKISCDGGNTFVEIAKCEDIDGIGVFSGIDLSDPTKMVLTQIDGTKIEIPCNTSFKLSFQGPAQDTVLIGGGESLAIPYELVVEGKAEQPILVTSGTDGTYTSRIEAGASAEKGIVHVQAPEQYSEGYILLTAHCGGYSAIKMISFSKRQVTPEKSYVPVRLGSGDNTRTVGYSTNFEYTVSASEEGWLNVVSDPGTGAIHFTAKSNAGSTVRSSIVTISPKDNPDYACTTFEVFQAHSSTTPTYALDPECPFTFDPDNQTLEVPSEGGVADIWISTSRELVSYGPEGAEWAVAQFDPVDGFYRLRITFDSNDTGESKNGEIQINIKGTGIPYGRIAFTQR